MRHWTYASRHHDPVGQVGGDEAEVLLVPRVDSLRIDLAGAGEQQRVKHDAAGQPHEGRLVQKFSYIFFGAQRDNGQPGCDLLDEETGKLGAHSFSAGGCATEPRRPRPACGRRRQRWLAWRRPAGSGSTCGGSAASLAAMSTDVSRRLRWVRSWFVGEAGDKSHPQLARVVDPCIGLVCGEAFVAAHDP